MLSPSGAAGFDMSRLRGRAVRGRSVDVAPFGCIESGRHAGCGRRGAWASTASRFAGRQLAQAIEKAEEVRTQAVAGPAGARGWLTGAEEAPEEEPDTSVRERLVDEARAARQAERWTPGSPRARPRSGPAPPRPGRRPGPRRERRTGVLCPRGRAPRAACSARAGGRGGRPGGRPRPGLPPEV